MTLTFGGKPIAAKAAPRQATLPEKDAPDRIVLFMRLVAMSLEARQQLRDAVDALREIDVDALDDPELADHPSRPAMLRLYEDRQADEHHAVVRLIECNASLSRQWDTIQPADKHRFGLTWIVGEHDPQAKIGVRLWCDDRGLARLVPFPDDWTVPHDLSHRVFDDTTEIREYTAEEVLHAEYPGF